MADSAVSLPFEQNWTSRVKLRLNDLQCDIYQDGAKTGTHVYAHTVF